MSLWTLMQSTVIFLNALAILNEDRFLNKYGWGRAALLEQTTKGRSWKSDIVGWIHAISYLRVPLILLNCIVILAKMISG
mmetsp:Transcript_45355/g.75645  ORF Transcript_45355/g.75645 Transcript_45355/m.75645 type:complete len:80 (+) Transcript_45355:305-544(+)